MTATHETPMSLFSHNKCGKVTTIKHCMEAGLIFYFTFYLFGGAYTPNPTGLLENRKPGAPAPFPVSVEKHFCRIFGMRRKILFEGRRTEKRVATAMAATWRIAVAAHSQLDPTVLRLHATAVREAR